LPGEEKMIKLSIIVPIYQVEAYLCKCIDSILHQTFSDYELILVDDGSTDRSGKICDSYATQDARIVVIHQSNGGLSAARNAGLSVAKGEYVAFIDGDDYIETSMYETMISLAVKYQADLVSCGIWNIYGDHKTSQCKELKEYVCGREEAYKKMMQGVEIPGSICNKLIKRECIKEIRFAVGKCYEDAFFVPQLMEQIDTVAVTTKPLYCYVHRQGSITTKPFTKDGMDIIEAYQLNYDNMVSRYPALKKEAQFRLLWAYFQAMDRIILAKKYKKNPYYAEVRNYLKQNWFRVVTNSNFRNSRRLGAVVLKINMSLYRWCALRRISS
jgi:glycosyltransferase involved in cell wall biosynthesis